MQIGGGEFNSKQGPIPTMQITPVSDGSVDNSAVGRCQLPEERVHISIEAPHTHIHTHKHTHTQAHKNTQAHTSTHKHTHHIHTDVTTTQTHTKAPTHPHTHPQTHARTYTCTQKRNECERQNEHTFVLLLPSNSFLFRSGTPFCLSCFPFLCFSHSLFLLLRHTHTHTLSLSLSLSLVSQFLSLSHSVSLSL
jgi:hypothetical protein